MWLTVQLHCLLAGEETENRNLDAPPRLYYNDCTLMRGRAAVARRAHNPEVSGSNPLPATNENRSPWGYGSLIGLRVDGYEKSLLGGFFDEP